MVFKVEQTVFAMILAGGVGTRLWPRSRRSTPKQFLDLLGERTMLQATVDRVTPLIPPDRILVMTNAEYVDDVRAQLPELPVENVIGEPAPRGTGPAVGLAAWHIRVREPNAVMLSLHADHYIRDDEGFRRALRAGAEVAHEGWLVNLGVKPTYPATGLGWVELGDRLGEFQGIEVAQVKRFVEKPDLETAEQFLASGRYLWNSGIFAWRVDVILQQFEVHLPEIAERLAQIGAAIGTPEADRTLSEVWATLKGETTIDRGIMERATHVATVPMDVGWDDVGSWSSLAALLPADGDGNVIKNPEEPVLIDCKNVFVYSPGKFIAAVGLEDLVVVDTGDALLLCRRDRVQDVKQVVNALQSRGRTDLL